LARPLIQLGQNGNKEIVLIDIAEALSRGQPFIEIKELTTEWLPNSAEYGKLASEWGYDLAADPESDDFVTLTFTRR
jgi:hypothetical protein